jgi:penicillin-binding protein 1A
VNHYIEFGLMKKPESHVYRADLMEAKRHQKMRSQIMSILFWGLFWGCLFGGGILGFNYLFGDMPQVGSEQELWVSNRPASLEVVDSQGRTITLRGPRFGRRVPIDELPARVITPFLAVEDARFFEHKGVDFVGVARAMVKNITAGHTVQGASTITQQLVKNVFLNPHQTIKRKAQEMVLAWQIDSKFPKKKILEVYLNRIYFGNNAYGIDAAAWRYFSKKPQELTLGEAAMLAGLPKAPGRLSIDITAKPALDRRAVVLQRMVEAHFITPQLAAEVAKEPIIIKTTPDPDEGELAYAVDMAAKEIDALDPPISPDRIARITIDPRIQQDAVETIQKVLAQNAGSGVNQAALIAIDKQGRILAIVGGRSYKQSQFNRVTQAKRQPGSTFKPLVYAAALEMGMTPNTIKEDKPIDINGWKPQNFGKTYSGKVTLSTALTKSINTIAVQLAVQVGLDRVIGTAQRLGIESQLPKHPSIALGAGEVTLMDMTRAYATLANDGVRVEPYLIDRVDTTRNTIAYERKSHAPTQVYDPLKARQMTAMLGDVIAFGTGHRAQLANGREAAGKTGTSQNFRDAWFVGYTADIICGVWVGNDEFKPMNGVSGGTLPAIIWSSFMNKAHEGMPLKPLPTIDDLNRPDSQTMAMFYESLAEFFSSAGGESLGALGQERKRVEQ